MPNTLKLTTIKNKKIFTFILFRALFLFCSPSIASATLVQKHHPILKAPEDVCRTIFEFLENPCLAHFSNASKKLHSMAKHEMARRILLIQKKIAKIYEYYGPTPAIDALTKKDLATLQLLAQHDSEAFHYKNAQGQNVAHLSAMIGFTEAFQLVIQYAPEILFEQDDFGYTPAHWAGLSNQNGSILKLIAEHAPNTFRSESKWKIKPITIARSQSSVESLIELEEILSKKPNHSREGSPPNHSFEALSEDSFSGFDPYLDSQSDATQRQCDIM
jgi:ankyrin repeat protein